MPPQPPLHTAVLSALRSGTLVLTANQRAARTLHTAYAHNMRAEGKTLWPPPNISTWENWTTTLWQQLVLRGAETRLLLAPLQERLLWKKILAEDAASSTLRSPDSLASLAANAWSLLAQYNGLDASGTLSPLRAQFEAASTDTRTFLRWAQQFERRCRKESLLSSAQLETALLPHIAQLSLPGSITLVGFDRIPPAQSALCNALRTSGISVETLTLPDEPRSLRIMEAADEAAELHLAARAIRDKLTASPEARIAVILPDVAAIRSRLERIFLSELAPELQTAGADQPRPFEFSLGITLNRIAMTRTALSLLRWTLDPLPLEEVSALLLSPYLAGSQAERYTRATWDAQQLRRAKLLEPEIPLAWALQQKHLPPHLQQQLTALQKLAAEKNLSARQKKSTLASYAFWVEHAAALLTAAGWPGNSERPLDSIEFQLQQRWQEMLDSIATLDFAGEPADFSTALTAIERAAAETLFAPQSHNAPVQIMSTLESAGSAFDSIWFLGATDMAWPATTSTHPFIPWSVQRTLTMPGADNARTMADGTAITQRIAASAPVVTFSFARHGKEGAQRASTCLRELKSAEWLHDDSAVTLPAPLLALEDAPDDAALPTLPDEIIHGGATILKLQAQCPFRAFAERRLYSTALENTEAGLDAQERGNLIHNVLATFWNGVGTQTALLHMPPAECRQRLEAAIDAALRMKAEGEWQTAYLKVQRAWLLELLPQWLEKELQRPSFQVVATEQRLPDRTIGLLRIEVRVDRIDTVPPNGQEIILDYKTGLIPSKPWDGDRPEEPQLPLYAVLAHDRPVHGIAFARLKVGKMELQQCSGADFDAQLPQWRTVLTALATSFAHGDTAVDPKRPATCKHCAQMPLCRIRETRFDDEEDSDG
jgi:probable DNA repair protein